MDCKLLTCDEEATARVIHPFGTSNLCAAHADAAGTDRSAWSALELACRYGPAEDPPLEDAERGPEYARPNGLGA